MLLRSLVLVFALLMAISANSAETIRLGIGDWCPYVCDSNKEDGKQGYVTDIAVLIFTEAGFIVNVDSMPFARNIQQTSLGTQNGSVAMYRSDAPGFIFPDIPLGKSSGHFFTRKGDGWYYGVDNHKLLTLVDRKIGLIKGYDYPDKDFMTFVNYNPDNVYLAYGNNPLRHLLAFLFADKIDTLLDDPLVVTYNLQKMNALGQASESGLLGPVKDVYIGFSPGIIKSKEYARILSKGVVRIRNTGQLNKILENYGLKDWEL